MTDVARFHYYHMRCFQLITKSRLLYLVHCYVVISLVAVVADVGLVKAAHLKLMVYIWLCVRYL